MPLHFSNNDDDNKDVKHDPFPRYAGEAETIDALIICTEMFFGACAMYPSVTHAHKRVGMKPVGTKPVWNETGLKMEPGPNKDRT